MTSARRLPGRVGKAEVVAAGDVIAVDCGTVVVT